MVTLETKKPHFSLNLHEIKTNEMEEGRSHKEIKNTNFEKVKLLSIFIFIFFIRKKINN
jgi:hypothetical protein